MIQIYKFHEDRAFDGYRLAPVGDLYIYFSH